MLADIKQLAQFTVNTGVFDIPIPIHTVTIDNLVHYLQKLLVTVCSANVSVQQRPVHQCMKFHA